MYNIMTAVNFVKGEKIPLHTREDLIVYHVNSRMPLDTKSCLKENNM